MLQAPANMKVYFILFVVSALFIGIGLTASPWTKLYKSIPVQKEEIKDVQMSLGGIATDCCEWSIRNSIIVVALETGFNIIRLHINSEI